MYKIHYLKHDIYRIYVKRIEVERGSIQTEATNKVEITLQDIIINIIIIILII